MPPKKTPTSSLSGTHAVYFPLPHITTINATVIELLVKRVWHRTLVRIRRMRSGGVSPDDSTARSSPATRLPQEVVEMIIAYLIYDTRSLRACTLTCRSIAAVPHLHQTLTTTVGSWGGKLRWPMLGLLPLIRELRIHVSYGVGGFSLRTFNCCVLRQFLTLTNVQKLEIQQLDIPKFMPRIQRYFRCFIPTLGSLALKSPRGAVRLG